MACPGTYCGRVRLDDGILGECGACPRGQTVGNESICFDCNKELTTYDWLYLGTIVLSTIVVHVLGLRAAASKVTQTKLFLVLSLVSATLESLLSAIIALLLFDPVGKLNLRSCGVNRLSDWYTIFLNPRPRYTETIHCAQEAVYPLYTLVFAYYGLALVTLLLFRPIFTWKFRRYKSCRVPVYFEMYSIPVLVIVHAGLAGLLYFAFPYLTLLGTTFWTVHFMNSRRIEGLKQLFTNSGNVCMILLHCCMYCYGIGTCLVSSEQPAPFLAFLLLAPVPAAFYLLTSPFTDPVHYV
ncbi:JNK1/MAPK8-associated membrane protein-like isoform X1 [Oscarella lobularis]|uniref:JNK1/MAPK8-associated membrane protein-like isoform X1 n=1 Tax=Oscarella lobularis TaxID=121494 RepID=UPI003313198B